MALPDSIKYVDGTEFILSSGDWAGGAAGWKDTADVGLGLADLPNGSYRQSAKLDLTANRDTAYSLSISTEFATNPTNATTVDVWVGYSPSGDAGVANPADLSGTDIPYTGYVNQLDFVGSLELTSSFQQADNNPQIGPVGIIVPEERYAMFVIYNDSGASMADDGVELALRLRALNLQVQD